MILTLSMVEWNLIWRNLDFLGSSRIGLLGQTQVDLWEHGDLTILVLVYGEINPVFTTTSKSWLLKQAFRCLWPPLFFFLIRRHQ